MRALILMELAPSDAGGNEWQSENAHLKHEQQSRQGRSRQREQTHHVSVDELLNRVDRTALKEDDSVFLDGLASLAWQYFTCRSATEKEAIIRYSAGKAPASALPQLGVSPRNGISTWGLRHPKHLERFVHAVHVYLNVQR